MYRYIHFENLTTITNNYRDFYFHVVDTRVMLPTALLPFCLHCIIPKLGSFMTCTCDGNMIHHVHTTTYIVHMSSLHSLCIVQYMIMSKPF